MFSRDKAPVGGICIKEIFEVNVVPFTFGMFLLPQCCDITFNFDFVAPKTTAMTYQFFKTMMRFCFPEKDPETLEGETEHSDSSSSSSLSRKGGKHFSGVGKTKKAKESNFYVSIEDKDDVEKMKVAFLKLLLERLILTTCGLGTSGKEQTVHLHQNPRSTSEGVVQGRQGEEH